MLEKLLSNPNIVGSGVVTVLLVAIWGLITQRVVPGLTHREQIAWWAARVDKLERENDALTQTALRSVTHSETLLEKAVR